jgi:hypothetical protein
LVTIALDSPTLTGSPGGVLQFFGTLSNTTNANLYLNADNFNLGGFDPSAIDDSPFFANAPLFLGPDGSTGDIGLFDIAIPNAFPPGNYVGVFQVLGGVSGDSQDIIGSVGFTATVQQSAVPEPGFRLALFLALVVFVLSRHIHRVGDGRLRGRIDELCALALRNSLRSTSAGWSAADCRCVFAPYPDQFLDRP